MKEALDGGRENQIFRSGNVVIRPSAPWSDAVQQLLRHLQNERFSHAPQPLGFDENGNEKVTFIEGEVSNYPLSDAARSEEALISAAKLLRSYHDITRSFMTAETLKLPWMLPACKPAEVICHGDYAPYNTVLNGTQTIGIIDFDTAHPGPCIWDIAYAVYRWAPLSHPNHSESFGQLNEQIQRAKLFCAAYGLSQKNRKMLIHTMSERLTTLVDFMQTEAANGNETFASHLKDGHHLIYLKDIEYLSENQIQINAGLG